MQSKDIKQTEPASISRLSLPFHWRDYFVYIAFAIVLIFFAFTIAADGFFLPSNLFNIVRATTMISIMAVAMTFVISAGELDLSIGSTTAFSALISAMAMDAGYGMAGGVITGLLAGLVITPTAKRWSGDPEKF